MIFYSSSLIKIFLKRVGSAFEVLAHFVPIYISSSNRSLMKLLPYFPSLSFWNRVLPFSDSGFLGSVVSANFWSNSKKVWLVDNNPITFLSFFITSSLRICVSGNLQRECRTSIREWLWHFRNDGTFLRGTSERIPSGRLPFGKRFRSRTRLSLWRFLMTLRPRSRLLLIPFY